MECGQESKPVDCTNYATKDVSEKLLYPCLNVLNNKWLNKLLKRHSVVLVLSRIKDCSFEASGTEVRY